MYCARSWFPSFHASPGVEHGEHGVEVRRDELASRRWLVCTAALRVDVGVLVLVSLAIPGGARGRREREIAASEL